MMKVVHTIKLKGFWEQIDIHVWKRNFGKPRSIDADEQAWLVLSSPIISAKLNQATVIFSQNQHEILLQNLAIRNTIEIIFANAETIEAFEAEIQFRKETR